MTGRFVCGRARPPARLSHSGRTTCDEVTLLFATVDFGTDTFGWFGWLVVLNLFAMFVLFNTSHPVPLYHCHHHHHHFHHHDKRRQHEAANNMDLSVFLDYPYVVSRPSTSLVSPDVN